MIKKLEERIVEIAVVGMVVGFLIVAYFNHNSPQWFLDIVAYVNSLIGI